MESHDEENQEQFHLNPDEICVKARRREQFSVAAYWTILVLAVLFAAGFIRNLIYLSQSWLIAGTAWALAALCVIAWRLLRKGPHQRHEAEPCARFLIRELEGKRDGVLWIRWLALLLFPAAVGCWLGDGPVLEARMWGVRSPIVLQCLESPFFLLAFGLIVAFVWFAFTRHGRKISLELDRLRAQMR